MSTPSSDGCATCPVHNLANLKKLGVDMANWDYVVALAGNPNTGKSTVFKSDIVVVSCGAINSAAELTDGVHHLKLEVEDRAGNSIAKLFEVDVNSPPTPDVGRFVVMPFETTPGTPMLCRRILLLSGSAGDPRTMDVDSEFGRRPALDQVAGVPHRAQDGAGNHTNCR